MRAYLHFALCVRHITVNKIHTIENTRTRQYHCNGDMLDCKEFRIATLRQERMSYLNARCNSFQTEIFRIVETTLDDNVKVINLPSKHNLTGEFQKIMIFSIIHMSLICLLYEHIMIELFVVPSSR